MALTKPKAYQLYDIDYKQAALVVTTNNIVLSGAAPNIIDGVVLAQNSRILVAGQTNQSQNGIYYVSILGSGANGTWLRSQDAVTTGQLLSGTIITVTEGTVNRDTQWMVTTDGVITIGTTGITFTKISDKTFSEVDANGVPIVATTFGDTLTLVSGNNISINANANTKTITISSTFAEPTRIINGSSNVTIPTANGNVAINVGTVANVGVFSPSGLNLFGSLSATGNASILGNLVVGGSYTVGNITAGNLTLPHGSYIIGDMIPSLDSTFSLGNSTRKWKDLWLSNSTLYLGQIPIRTNSANQMTVNSNVVLTANTNSVVNLSNLTLLDTLTANEVYVSNANRDATVSADIVVATVVDANLLIGNGAFITDIYSNANVANYLPTYTGPIGNGNSTINAGNADIGAIVISSSNIATNASSNVLTLDPSTASGTTGVVFVNGNFNSSNTITGGNIVSNASIIASGPISTSNTIVGNGIVSNSTISATGNVSGGNITTSGDIVANGTLTVGDIYPTGDIIPSANVTYSLGNSTNQWKDLWVSNSTIYIDSIPLSVNSNNELTFDGNTIVTADENANGNVTAAYFVGDGAYLSNIQAANISGSYGNANVAAYLGANTTNVNIYSNAIVANTVTISDLSITGNSISTITGDTITIDPAGVGSTGNVVIEGKDKKYMQ